MALKENHGTFNGKLQCIKVQVVHLCSTEHVSMEGKATLVLVCIPRLAHILKALDYGNLRCATHVTLNCISNVSVALTTVFSQDKQTPPMSVYRH